MGNIAPCQECVMTVKNMLFVLATTNPTPEALRFYFNVSLNWADKEDAKLLFRLYTEACKK
jgi:hypothetical protein